MVEIKIGDLLMSDKIYVALGPNVFVKEVEKNYTKNGWIMPETLETDFTFGEVISCGEGYFDHGSYIPAQIKAGDIVAFPKISGAKLTLNGTKFIKVHMADIMAKEVDGKIIDEKEGE